MKYYLSQTFAISGLFLALSSALQAQNTPLSNSGEAVSYTVALDQGNSTVRSAVDFALANAHSARGLTAGYDFSNIETDSSSNRRFEGDIDQNAFHVNYGHAFGDLITALQLSYVDSQADADFRDTNTGKVEIDADGWFLASTLGYTWEGFNFGFIAGIGSLSNDTSRVGVIPDPKKASPDSDLYTIGLVVDYTIYEQEGFSLTPRMGLNYSNVEVDPITETTAPADSGVLDSMDREWLIASLELIFGWEANEKLKLNAALGWHYDFENDETTLSVVDSDGAGSITLPDVGESVFKGGLSANYALDDNWSLGADVNIYSGDDLNGVSLGAVLAYRF